ncbi:MAG TPA: sugar ABC transporter substrate-binding protein [Candidatus Choladousia intestinipullorum]|nr:sugar ABC transporter substrate-binding protein [Candidatus Choladousia intestinipullorum]
MMIRKKKRQRLLLLALALCMLLLLLYYAVFSQSVTQTPQQFSVILYQYTDNDWTSLQDGIRQAEKDENVVVNYVSVSPNTTIVNELELIAREIENGAEGVLFAPVDSDIPTDRFNSLTETAPIVTLETGIGETDADISANNYEMGYRLGSEIGSDMLATGEKHLYLIKEYMERQSVRQRFQGVTDAVKAAVPDAVIEEYQRSEGDYGLAVSIAAMYENGQKDAYIAALDKFCTEAVIEASQSSALEGDTRRIFSERAYGIGNTEKTVIGLDTGCIRGLVYQNEFNIGYQGLQALVSRTRSSGFSPAAIEFYYVTRDTLYEPEHQRLLFPLG